MDLEPVFMNPSEEEEDIEKEEETERELKEEFEKNSKIDVLKRFGNISQGNLVELTKSKFDKALETIINIANIAREVNRSRVQVIQKA